MLKGLGLKRLELWTFSDHERTIRGPNRDFGRGAYTSYHGVLRVALVMVSIARYLGGYKKGIAMLRSLGWGSPILLTFYEGWESLRRSLKERADGDVCREH